MASVQFSVWECIMFNQRECRPEIPQCHMAVTWSPLGPFVRCQKLGSGSVLPLNKFSFLSAALKLPLSATLKLFITRTTVWVNLDPLSGNLPSQRDQKSVRIMNCYIRHRFETPCGVHWRFNSYLILTPRSNLIKRPWFHLPISALMSTEPLSHLTIYVAIGSTNIHRYIFTFPLIFFICIMQMGFLIIMIRRVRKTKVFPENDPGWVLMNPDCEVFCIVKSLLIRNSAKPFPVVFYIGLCACGRSAKAKIPKFPPEGVSLPDTPRLPETPQLESFVFFCNIATSQRNTQDTIG